MEHSHVMGGSSAAKRVNCPASLSLESQQPKDDTPSEFAERGSMLHAAMELLLTQDPQDDNELAVFCAELVDEHLGFNEHFEDMVITEELVTTKIIPAWKAWCEIRDEYDIDDWMIEQKVNLEVIIDGAFGTSDLIASDTKGRLHILDWKFGDGVPVPAEGNQGMLFYAAGALNDDVDEELIAFIEELPDKTLDVGIHIVQPRVGSNYVRDSWMTDEGTVEAFVNQAVEAMKLAHGDNPPAKTGAWCRWCAARHTCPAQKGVVVEAIAKQPDSMTATELAESLALAKQVKNWADGIFKLAQKEMEGGAALPGWKLVEKRPSRVWALKPKDIEAELRAARVKVGDIFPRQMISPPQLEKLNKKVYSKLANKCVSMHSSGLTIAPDSDKREAVGSATELLANLLPEQEK